MSKQESSITRIGRRAFLKSGTLYLTAAGLESSAVAKALAEQDDAKPALRAGMVTDVHSADRAPGGKRHYRESKKKLAEAVRLFTREDTDFVIELGDFVDAAPTVEEELAFLKEINKVYSSAPGAKHYVLGNHCVYTLTKEEFLGTVGQPKAYYSFDLGGFHVIVLDACFRSDGMPYGRKNFEWTDPNIPVAELDWLRGDLQGTKNKSLVFLHQRLDVGGHYGVKNAPDVREVLEQSGKALAVFQGHAHQNDYKEIGGIHYCTLPALVDGNGETNSAYAILHAFANGNIAVNGISTAEKLYLERWLGWTSQIMPAKSQSSFLSVLVPAYNEEKTVAEVLQRVLSLGEILREAVVVDDGSTDTTADIVQRLAEDDGRIRLFRQTKNAGKTAAIRRALAEAEGEVLIIQDADLEYDPAEIPEVIAPILAGNADVVFGSRFLVRRTTRVLYFYHYLANKSLTFLSNLLTNRNMTDIETCYKAFRAGVIKPLELSSSGFGMEVEITAMICKTQAHTYEVPISYYGRSYREGKKIGIWDGIMAGFYILYFNIIKPRLPSGRRYIAAVNEYLGYDR